MPRSLQIIVCLLLCSLVTTPVFAQAEPQQSTEVAKPKKKDETKAPVRQFSKVPLIRMWFKVDETAAVNYMTELMNEYGLESSFVSGQLRAGRKMANAEPELQGMMVFMAKGLIPSAVQMQFRTVKDKSEFKDMIFKVKTQLGKAATLSGSGDHYQLDMDFSQGIPVYGSGGEGEDGDEPEMIAFPGMDQIQNNPAAMASMKQTIHFRLIDNIMWQGNMPEIMDFKFPTYDKLQPKKSARKFDVYGEFNLSEIPAYLKGMVYSAVSVTANAKMQQRDDEDVVDYEARKSNGQMWLEVLRTILYDVEKGRFSVQLADEEKPIRIQLDIEARKESSLAKAGRTIGRTATRFAAVRNRKAPLTLATTWGMPNQAKEAVTSALKLAKRKWEAELAGNSDALNAANRLGELVTETVEAGRTDLTVQLTGDVVTGFAFVGGLRLEKADEFQEAVDQLLTSSGELDRIEHTDGLDGLKFITVGTGEVPIPGVEGDRFESEVTFTTFDSCLWFGYGGPSAFALLEETIAFAKENRNDTRRTSTFQFAFDLSEWMKGEDNAEGFNQYPRQALVTLERQIDKALASMQVVLSGGEPQWQADLPPRDSFLLKALKRGGDEVDLKLRIDETGVDLDIEIGLGVANMLVARLIDAQGQVMDAMMSNKSGKFNIPGQRKGSPPPPAEAK